MVTLRRIPGPHRREGGSLMVELLVAMGILTLVMLPVAYSLTSEKRLARAAYQRAVAMEIVDGELEVLAAGAWRAFPEGEHEYQIQSLAATNLPAGRFVFFADAERLRLEWRPAVSMHGGPVLREVRRQ